MHYVMYVQTTVQPYLPQPLSCHDKHARLRRETLVMLTYVLESGLEMASNNGHCA